MPASELMTVIDVSDQLVICRERNVLPACIVTLTKSLYAASYAPNPEPTIVTVEGSTFMAELIITAGADIRGLVLLSAFPSLLTCIPYNPLLKGGNVTTIWLEDTLFGGIVISLAPPVTITIDDRVTPSTVVTKLSPYIVTIFAFPSSTLFELIESIFGTIMSAPGANEPATYEAWQPWQSLGPVSY